MKYVFIMLILAACNTGEGPAFVGRSMRISENNFHGTVVFSSRNKNPGFKISLVDDRKEIADRLIFDYPLYQVDSADVDRDGKTDILVGLIKSTQFDPAEKKRLFILRIDGGQLRPLWLGSRVCQELVMFKAIPGGIVRTLEKTQGNKYAIGLYGWRGFGLKLIKYSYNNISIEYARHLFNS